MADWDADSSQLRANLERLLRDIFQSAERREKFTATVIKRWHRQTMAGLTVPEQKFVGRFRGERGLEREGVFVGAREGTNPAFVGREARAFIKRLQVVCGRLDKLLPSGAELDRDRLEAVVELAAWAHSEWVRIHPFCNGNGRTARLLTNAILMRYGLPPALKLRPRPSSPYGQAGAAGLDGNSRPLETLLRRLLVGFPNKD